MTGPRAPRFWVYRSGLAPGQRVGFLWATRHEVYPHDWRPAQRGGHHGTFAAQAPFPLPDDWFPALLPGMALRVAASFTEQDGA